MDLRRLRSSGMSLLWIVLLQMLGSARHGVEGHGRLMDPPARNCMWRLGFRNPTNYNDNELYCGGHSVQWQKNNGECGVCGDAYHMAQPRPHETGGAYGNRIVTRRYAMGQKIEVQVELTANHLGTFVMKLCPNNNPNQEATQECFDKHPLYIFGTKDDRFPIPRVVSSQEPIKYTVQLPPNVTCSRCVVQWTYRTGNMWGKCPNGTEGLGCGPAETFRNCADISVVTSTAGDPPVGAAGDATRRRITPFIASLVRKNIIDPAFVKDSVQRIIRDQVCVPTEAFRNVPGMQDWCQTNCLRYPPNCPKNKCTCPHTCEGIGKLKGREGADAHCMYQCIVYPPKCPTDQCRCY